MNSFSTAPKLDVPRQSTRNNSVMEHLMIEDLNVTDLENQTIQENTLKYTCDVCHYVTTNKKNIDEHITEKHESNKNEEVTFMCTICNHEFREAESYDSHLKIHEVRKESYSIKELENLAFCDIIDHQISISMDCLECEHKAVTETQLKGPVSGFVGCIPLPSLESIITRNP